MRCFLNYVGPLRGRKNLFPPIALNRLSQDGAIALSNGPAGASSANHRNSGSIGLHKQTHRRIVNGWLALIVILGAVIASTDGLTRGPVLEREESWNGPLEYSPYPGTLLLAGVTFLLTLGYARKCRVSLTEALFLWFVFCTAAYSRDFSYIRLPGTPLFVTDIVLVILFVSTCLFPRPTGYRVPLAVNWLVALLLAAGTLSVMRGFAANREVRFVLRDAAMVAYPFFLYITHYWFRSWLAIRRVVTWFLLGTALSVVNGFAWFLAAPQERRFIYYGPYILICLVGTFVAVANRILSARLGWSLGSLFLLGLALANARSLFVALPVLIIVGVYAGGLVRGNVRRPRLAATTLVAAVLICGMTFLFFRTDAGRDFAERSTEGLDSGVFHSGDDSNWQFRIAAWKEAWHRFAEYPLAGEGFGIPFTFGIWDNDPRPHNTFLTVLYKTGLVGFLPLVSLIAFFFWITVRAVHRNLGNHTSLLWIVVLSQAAFCFYGAANLLLESPFLASLFWSFIGLGLRMTRMLDWNRAVMGSLHAH